ncbi:MAG: nucleoside monophosphate kinase [Nitrospirae bacterium]|nr:nucleoside monophosphate kinase [Candidatus Troglogloeales bacterium]
MSEFWQEGALLTPEDGLNQRADASVEGEAPLALPMEGALLTPIKMRLVFLGSPGVGKGTQAKRLSKQYSVPQVATGDMLRAAISKGTAEGKEAKSYVDSGRLVPDHLVIRIVQARLLEDDMRNGFILDGFPRTKEQADALFEMGVGIDKVLNFYRAVFFILMRMVPWKMLPDASKMPVDFNQRVKASVEGGDASLCNRPL